MEKINISGDFSAKQTFECGQCFRWELSPDGYYEGTAYGKFARISSDEIICSDGESGFWHDYLDLGRDYASIRLKLSADVRIRDAVEYGSGIRILRQEPWEALCSFIISQCNNIPRIKGIIRRLCELKGKKLSFAGHNFCTFPDACAVASMNDEELGMLRCGYRAPYIHGAAEAVACGALDLDAVSKLPEPEAKRELLKLRGVGEKVASCVLLFGMGKLESFPVDVWMKRAMAARFGEGFDPHSFGEYAGIAQQYIYYHALETKLKT